MDREVLEKIVEWKRKSEASMIEGEGNDWGESATVEKMKGVASTTKRVNPFFIFS